MTSTWAAETVRAVATALRPLADPAKAQPMRSYMKDVAPFLGIAGPARVAATRTVFASLSAPTQRELAAAARGLFRMDERELHYAAIDLLGHFVRPKRSTIGPEFLTDAVEELVTTKSWWDTVDGLRGAAVGPLVERNPDLVAVMRRWNASDDRWLVRSSIIHQLGRKGDTDEALLFELCENRAADADFFIAKAIGWALREYGKTNPGSVRRFVAETALRPLSTREALRAIDRGRA